MEFALVVPFLVLLLFGVINYGYMLSFRQAISQGAAEGARQAALAPPVVSQPDKVQRARDAINQALASYGVSCTGSDLFRNGEAVGRCAINSGGPCPSDPRDTCATVTLDYAYRDHALIPTVPGIGLVLPQHLAYTAVVQDNG